MNGNYPTQTWEAAVLGKGTSYSFWVSSIDGCLAQQKRYGINGWDYFTWRIR